MVYGTDKLWKTLLAKIHSIIHVDIGLSWSIFNLVNVAKKLWLATRVECECWNLLNNEQMVYGTDKLWKTLLVKIHSIIQEGIGLSWSIFNLVNVAKKLWLATRVECECWILLNNEQMVHGTDKLWKTLLAKIHSIREYSSGKNKIKQNTT